ncbi:class I SAM-dependent methyltransferase [Mucilaginibacter sp. CSA2-8R]|uniref:class I SAM-dependent methyltransferase n=1 Tax=Mucilaginibacter sp. CSA2-8R TaxID=3141542 RepID=UPI00315C9C2F
MNNLQALFGNIDIYLFDQLLKCTYNQCHKILDVGCGGGRNIVYFLQQRHDVYGIDPNPDAIVAVRELSVMLTGKDTASNFSVGSAETMPFEANTFDLVICSAVLHFAQSKQHFEAMLTGIWQVLKPGGYLFARLASNIGIESLVQPLGNNRYLLPDGSERFLVSEQDLMHYTQKLNGYLHEPIKTTNVQNLRCMTTWCLQKL